MAHTIITKNSSTAGAVPSAGSLTKGELAVNVTDRRLYTKDNAGSVVEVGSGTSIIYRDNFTGDGSTVAFTLLRTPLNEELVDIYCDGVYQGKDTFSISGAVVTFDEAPLAGASIEVMTFQSSPIGETAANYVSYTPAGTGAVVTTVQSKLREFDLIEPSINTAVSLGGTPATTPGVNDNVLIGGTGTFTSTISATRPAWDALGTDPTASGNDLGLTGTQMSNSVNSAVVLGGRESYYSSVGPTASLSLTYNADNITNHLAGVNLGFHTDLIQGLAEDGVTQKGSHGAICGGSFQQVAGDYSGSFAGQMKQVFALQSVAIGGKNIKIGSTANVDAVRRAFTIGGLTNQIVAGYQNGIVGGETNTIQSGDDSVIVGGSGNTVSALRGLSLCALNSTVTAEGAAAHGRAVKANVVNTLTKSSGSFSEAGDSQTHFIESRRSFTGTTNFLSNTGGAGTDLFTPETNTTGIGVFEIAVQQTGTSSSNMAAFIVKFAYSNVGGTLTIKGQSTETVFEDNAAFNAVAEIVGASTRIGIRVTVPDTNTYRSTGTGRIVVNRIVP